MTPEHEMAADLLDAIWRGTAADYKSKYRRNIWEQLENNARSAATSTNDLGKFVNSLCLKMNGAMLGKTNEERQKAIEILNGHRDSALLKLMREQTMLIVLMVRQRNDQRREAYEDRIQELEKERAMRDDPLFATVEE